MEPKVNDQRELISMLLILFILLGVCQHMDISYVAFCMHYFDFKATKIYQIVEIIHVSVSFFSFIRNRNAGL